MALDIETFSNVSGGFPFFKAAGHPAVRESARALSSELSGSRSRSTVRNVQA